jgi:hypothetical protein
MTRLKCFLTNAAAPAECRGAACADCARALGMLADLDGPRPRDLEYDVPEHVLQAARRITAASGVQRGPITE